MTKKKDTEKKEARDQDPIYTCIVPRRNCDHPELSGCSDCPAAPPEIRKPTKGGKYIVDYANGQVFNEKNAPEGSARDQSYRPDFGSRNQ